MTVKSRVHNDRPSAPTDSRRSFARCARFEALEKSDIAELSPTVINKMTCEELLRMIRVANLPDLMCPDIDEHLPFYDHNVLTRLGHLAQRCCRNHGTGTLVKDAE